MSEPNPHLELSDEEYLLICGTDELTPDEIEQQIIIEEEYGK